MATKIWGIDVSSHQGYIDWSKVKRAGVKFVIIRGGYGNSKVDNRFKQNIEGAIKNGIDVGIYWFSYAINTKKAKTEAELCFKTIEPYKDKINYPVYYDLEYDTVRYARTKGVTIGKNLASSMAKAFLGEVQKQGYKVGLYTNLDYAKNYFTTEVLKKYDIWVAHYARSLGYWGDYTIWQYSEKGRIDGIRGNTVDLNYCYKDYSKYKNNHISNTNKSSSSDESKSDKEIVFNINVKQLQNALNLSYNLDLELDGLFGPLTREALKKHYLRKGESNEFVRFLQEKLKELNYDIVVDGDFGPKTEKIVKKYQEDNNLEVDGFAGFMTNSSIIENLK